MSMNQISLIMGKDIKHNIEIQQRILDKVYNPQDPQEEVNNIHISKMMNDTIADAKQKPNPIQLYKNLFFENEVCCLFANTNLGKSVLAVQIAEEIAKNQHKRVLYFDYELSDKQLQLRYDDNGSSYIFSDNFLRAEINPDLYTGEDIITDIEKDAVRLSCNVIIIDNLTWIADNNENAESAAELMKKLRLLKGKYGWSILVLAHTPKGTLNNPITQDSLAGSKALMNFFDSAFAIGKSTKGENVRYIKQIKARNTMITYGTDNVLECEITKEGGFLHFKEIETSPEKEHLKEYLTDEEKQQRDEDILSLLDEGKSYRQIAKKLECSISLISKVVKRNKNQNKEEELKFD